MVQRQPDASGAHGSQAAALAALGVVERDAVVVVIAPALLGLAVDMQRGELLECEAIGTGLAEEDDAVGGIIRVRSLLAGAGAPIRMRSWPCASVISRPCARGIGSGLAGSRCRRFQSSMRTSVGSDMRCLPLVGMLYFAIARCMPRTRGRPQRLQRSQWS